MCAHAHTHQRSNTVEVSSKIWRTLIPLSLERSKLKGWLDNLRKTPRKFQVQKPLITYTTNLSRGPSYKALRLLLRRKTFKVQRSLPGRRVIPDTSHFTRYKVSQQGLHSILTLSSSHFHRRKSILSNGNLW